MTLCDTGPLIALLGQGDPNTARCVPVLNTLRPPLVTTQACFAEAMYLIGKRAGFVGQLQLWRMVQTSVLTLAETGPDAMRRAEEFMRTYSDLPCDYADATLLALAEEIGATTVFTLDKHFYAYRLAGAKFLIVVP